MNNRLRRLALMLIGALVVEYALGMYVDLFVSFPQGQTGEQLWGFAWNQVSLALHIVLAFIIFISAIVLCIRAIQAHDKTWIIASFVGLFSVISALGSGASFVTSQNEVLSFSMALTFIVAVLSYGWGMVGGTSQKNPGL